ncbi:MAG: hypothetical protein ABI693_12550 [Bryobacteraceae bacterium]
MPALENNHRVYVKSYFANTIKEAIGQAREELGPDAMLLNSREATPEGAHLGAYEVVFATPPPAMQPVLEESTNPVEQLQRRMDEIRELVEIISHPPVKAPPPSAIVEGSLQQAGFTNDFASELVAAAQRRLTNESVTEIGRPRALPVWDVETILQSLQVELRSRITVQPETGRVTALVGPPGCGKTTALVKLAVRAMISGRPVRLLSTDNCRIAAADQLRSYSVLLGLPFRTLEAGASLEKVVSSFPENSLVLIDTPGFSSAALSENGGGLSTVLSGYPDIDIHLVLPAYMRGADMARVAGRYEAFHPTKLLFTNLDETESFAAMFSEAARSGLPLSFFGTGQVVPDDMEPASIARITESLPGASSHYERAVA